MNSAKSATKLAKKGITNWGEQQARDLYGAAGLCDLRDMVEASLQLEVKLADVKSGKHTYETTHKYLLDKLFESPKYSRFKDHKDQFSVIIIGQKFQRGALDLGGHESNLADLEEYVLFTVLSINCYDPLIDKYVSFCRGTRSWDEGGISVSSFFATKFGFTNTIELTKLGIHRPGSILATVYAALTNEDCGIPSLKEQFLKSFEKFKDPKKGIACFGHSMGGAMADVALLLAERFGFEGYEVTTFGQLNALNKEGVQALDEFAVVRCMQLQGDPVPTLRIANPTNDPKQTSPGSNIQLSLLNPNQYLDPLEPHKIRTYLHSVITTSQWLTYQAPSTAATKIGTGEQQYIKCFNFLSESEVQKELVKAFEQWPLQKQKQTVVDKKK